MNDLTRPDRRSPRLTTATRDPQLRGSPRGGLTGGEEDGAIIRTEPAPTWWSRAACRGLPTDLFFPIGSGETALQQASLAKVVCMRCAVRQECLDYALDVGQPYGIFGGTTEEERRTLTRGPAQE